jgi:hypothetical protein
VRVPKTRRFGESVKTSEQSLFPQKFRKTYGDQQSLLKIEPCFVNSTAMLNFLLRSVICLLVFLGMTIFWTATFDAGDDGLGASLSRLTADIRGALFFRVQ